MKWKWNKCNVTLWLTSANNFFHSAFEALLLMKIRLAMFLSKQYQQTNHLEIQLIHQREQLHRIRLFFYTEWSCQNGLARMVLPEWSCQNGLARMVLPFSTNIAILHWSLCRHYGGHTRVLHHQPAYPFFNDLDPTDSDRVPSPPPSNDGFSSLPGSAHPASEMNIQSTDVFPSWQMLNHSNSSRYCASCGLFYHFACAHL